MAEIISENLVTSFTSVSLHLLGLGLYSTLTSRFPIQPTLPNLTFFSIVVISLVILRSQIFPQPMTSKMRSIYMLCMLLIPDAILYEVWLPSNNWIAKVLSRNSKLSSEDIIEGFLKSFIKWIAASCLQIGSEILMVLAAMAAFGVYLYFLFGYWKWEKAEALAASLSNKKETESSQAVKSGETPALHNIDGEKEEETEKIDRVIKFHADDQDENNLKANNPKQAVILDGHPSESDC